MNRILPCPWFCRKESLEMNVSGKKVFYSIFSWISERDKYYYYNSCFNTICRGWTSHNRDRLMTELGFWVGFWRISNNKNRRDIHEVFAKRCQIVRKIHLNQEFNFSSFTTFPLVSSGNDTTKQAPENPTRNPNSVIRQPPYNQLLLYFTFFWLLLRTFAPIVSVHPYCARKFTRHVMHESVR